jgi:hypothetical protein
MFVAALLGAAPYAHAWTSVRNETSNTIHLLYSFSAVSGIGCGYDDGCDDDNLGARAQGWFIVQPGQSIRLNDHAHHNAVHNIYAEDDLGHSWSGSIENFDAIGIPGFPFPQSIDACFQIPPDVPGSIMFSGFMVWPAPDEGACCGAFCEPEDFEQPLTLDPADLHFRSSVESVR